MILNKDFTNIDVDDLNSLIRTGVLEGNNLEFKREIWKKDDDGVREMMKDISSLANAYGGYLIIGIEQDESGRAAKLIEVPNAEFERDRILASCITNLQPRVMGLDIRSIEFEVGKKVLVIKVPRDIHIHQITFKGLYQFWKRHDRQKSKMTYDEIKESINRESFSLVKMEDFIQRRKNEINTGESLIMLSALPLKLESEILKINNQELRRVIQDDNLERLSGWGLNFRGGQPKPTLNGLRIEGYKQIAELYRNGYFEVISSISEGYSFEKKDININGSIVSRNFFRSAAIVELTYSFINRLKTIVSTIGYDAPYIFSINLFHIKNFALPEHHHNARLAPTHNSRVWEKESLELPLITFETIDPKIITKDLCDRIWQAYGYENEPYFIDGNFKF